MMHLMRQVGGRLACQQERSRVRGRSIHVLHRDAQTVDERLDGWRYRQLCRNLDHDTIAGALLDVLAAIRRCHDGSATNSPAHVALELTVHAADSRVRLGRVDFHPDGSNARTTLQIRGVRIRRVTGKWLRYHVVVQYISPTRRVRSRRAS
jgi:hypothetical protein